ncbi:MAG: glycosyltransferase family 4 protein, partial [Bacteroidales bacterium]|nr:glycosyltransferase family 4 protein [Bacteroidales bacterium]
NNFHYRKGGSEAVYFNTGRMLEAHGHEVVWFSFADEKNEPCAQSSYFPFRSTGLRGACEYFYNSKVEKALTALLEAENPDIADVHLIWGGMTPSIFKPLRKAGIPLVHTVHDYRMVCPAYTFRNGAGEICEKCRRGCWLPCVANRCSKGSLAKSAMMTAEMYWREWFHNPLKNIDGFVFVSRFCEGKHIQHNPGFAKARRIVLYNTVDLPATASKARGDYFLYYGRLSYEKGVEDLISAFSADGMPNLMIVGTGPLEEKLRTRAAGCSNIEFLGYRSGEALFDLVRDASFVVVPSRWYENNPMTIVEAYACGTPVIGSAIGGIPEIVEGTGAGWLYEAGNIDALNSILRKADSLDEEGYTRMCSSARSFYETHFSPEAHFSELISFFESIVCEKRR